MAGGEGAPTRIRAWGLGWSFSRYLELLPIVTPINASTDATVMTPINATPVAVPDLLYLRVVNASPWRRLAPALTSDQNRGRR